MQILVIGFRGSGNTILRRLLSVHPEISGVYVDKFLMHRCDTLEDVDNYVKRKCSTFNQSWIEILSYYNEIDVVAYCKKWSKMFGNTARIIHLIRHPFDVAQVLSKRECDSEIYIDALEIYKNKIRTIIPKLSHVPNVLTVKYEDLLLNPDEKMPEIYSHCNVDINIDFRAALLNRGDKKFINSLDTSGVFAHKYKEKIFKPVDMRSTIDVINNTVDGEPY
jgi:hypothetical protein